MVRIDWVEGVRRLWLKYTVKGQGYTLRLPLILGCWSTDAAGGMCGVAVKCIDITQNPDCEGIWRIRN